MKEPFYYNLLLLETSKDTPEDYIDIINAASLHWHFRSYNLWLGSLGKIFIINGPSSTGKSTVCKILENRGLSTASYDEIKYELYLKYLYDKDQNIYNNIINYFSKELIILIASRMRVYESYLENNKYVHRELLDSFISIIEISYKSFRQNLNFIEAFKYMFQEKLLPIISRGENIGLDLMLFGENDVSMINAIFNYYPNIQHLLLYKDAETLLNNCNSRNNISFKTNGADFRLPLRVLEQYTLFHKFQLGNKDKAIEVIHISVLKNLIERATELNEMIMDKLGLQTDFMPSIINFKVFIENPLYTDISILPAYRFDYIGKKTEEIVEYILLGGATNSDSNCSET